ncbi:MAG: M23 family metallopeptidase [Alphaproteobacteria bacterium]|nr:M23 family metallopeptidase [Alphaproteobacteria bacterium]
MRFAGRLALGLLLLSALPARADMRFTGSIEQGALVLGQAAPGSRVALDGVPVMVGPDGRFALGFSREAGPSAELTLQEPGAQARSLRLAVVPRSWDIQRIDGLPEKQVTPDPQTQERINRENALIAKARAQSVPKALFESGFQSPAEGQISGVFGSQRILNGQPRSPHSGVDLAAPTGTPVIAAADGVVMLAEPDLFYTGQTLLIDHGLGVNTVYAHLSALLVAPGSHVVKGQEIGKVGATGRVTGAHLHWGLSVGAVKLDPMTALKLTPPSTTLP